MLTALWLSCLAASPSYAIMVTRRVGVTPAQAKQITDQLAKELLKVELPIGTQLPPKAFEEALKSLGLDDPTSCAGATPCVSDYGRGGGVETIIGLQLMKVGKEVAIDTSVVRVSKADVVASPTESALLASPAKGIAALAKKLVEALRSRPPDEPVAAKPEPEPELKAPPPAETAAPPPEPAAEVRVTPPPKRQSGTPALRVVSFILGGMGVACGGVGLSLGIVSQQQATALLGSDPDYDAKRAATLGLARTADILYIAAGALALTAVVLFIVSVVRN